MRTVTEVFFMISAAGSNSLPDDASMMTRSAPPDMRLAWDSIPRRTASYGRLTPVKSNSRVSVS